MSLDSTPTFGTKDTLAETWEPYKETQLAGTPIPTFGTKNDLDNADFITDNQYNPNEDIDIILNNG